MTLTGTRAETLSDEECSALLQAHRFGRLAVHGPDGLAIFPVNYVFDSGRLAIRTDPGTKLSGAVQSEVAFEIDWIDEANQAGWSVLVQGSAYDVTDSIDDASRALRQLPVQPWAGPKSRWLRIEPRTVTGRIVRSGR